jgi:hypothetical protein
MKSQIPALAAKYFELAHVDLADNHPVVTAWFRPGKGWLPTIHPVRVSHTYLVRIRDTYGVTSVQLTAGSRQPEFTLAEMVGNMGPLDAEMTDGVPVSEGSGVKAKRDVIAAVLASQGVSGDNICLFLDEADRFGHTEFVVEERGYSAADPRGELVQGWRYRLVTASPSLADAADRAYDLTVLTHERKVA